MKSRLLSAIAGAFGRWTTPSAESGQASLWPVPVGAGALAVGVGEALASWAPVGVVSRWLWPGGREAAIAMLQVVPTAVVTATAVTFSLMVLALQMASQQFSPRLLRQFTRDRIFKLVLATLVASFCFPVTVLRTIGDETDLPRLAVALTMVLGLASLGALVVLIAHVARVLRVDTIMRIVHAETHGAIRAFYPPGTADVTIEELPAPVGEPVVVSAERSGFVRAVDTARLTRAARRSGAVVKLEVRPGDLVVRGTPLALVWGSAELGAAEDLARSGVDLGYERTLDQDPSFGFRELTDIAVKALSPSVNDPATADAAIGHMADLLVALSERRLGPIAHRDEAGDLRLITVDRDYRYYLDLPCGQIRRYGAGEPTVLLSLLRLLRDVAVRCEDERRRGELRRQAALILATPRDGFTGDDVAALEDLGDRIERVLAGDVVGAFRDRAGVTRSM